MTKTLLLPLLLAALPLLANAQNATQDSLLRSGDLVGGRPRASKPRPATARRAAVPASANADPYLAHLLHESIDLSRVPAGRMMDLYSNFIDAVRADRRKWTDADWNEAGEAITRINARYEVVRQELPLDDRLTIRSYQAEFRALQGATRLKESLD